MRCRFRAKLQVAAPINHDLCFDLQQGALLLLFLLLLLLLLLANGVVTKIFADVFSLQITGIVASAGYGRSISFSKQLMASQLTLGFLRIKFRHFLRSYLSTRRSQMFVIDFLRKYCQLTTTQLTTGAGSGTENAVLRVLAGE